LRLNTWVLHLHRFLLPLFRSQISRHKITNNITRENTWTTLIYVLDENLQYKIDSMHHYFYDLNIIDNISILCICYVTLSNLEKG